MARLKPQRQKGLRALKGALRSKKGTGMSFKQIREAAARALNNGGPQRRTSEDSR